MQPIKKGECHNSWPNNKMKKETKQTLISLAVAGAIGYYFYGKLAKAGYWSQAVKKDEVEKQPEIIEKEPVIVEEVAVDNNPIAQIEELVVEDVEQEIEHDEVPEDLGYTLDTIAEDIEDFAEVEEIKGDISEESIEEIVEVTDDVLEDVAAETVEDIVDVGTEEVVEEAIEEIAEDVVEEVVAPIVEIAVDDTVEDAVENIVEEIETTQDIEDNTIEDIIEDDIDENIVEDSVDEDAIEASVEEIVEDIVDEMVEESDANVETVEVLEVVDESTDEEFIYNENDFPDDPFAADVEAPAELEHEQEPKHEIKGINGLFDKKFADLLAVADGKQYECKSKDDGLVIDNNTPDLIIDDLFVKDEDKKPPKPTKKKNTAKNEQKADAETIKSESNGPSIMENVMPLQKVDRKDEEAQKELKSILDTYKTL